MLPQQILGFGVISLIPILGWLWFFNKKQPEKRSYVILTFLAGMCSVLPIKLYEKYWNTNFLALEHLDLFRYLAELVESPNTAKFITYVVSHGVVAIGFFLFVAAMMFVLEVFSFDNSARLYRQKAKKIWESPAFFTMVGLLCGAVAFWASESLSQKIWFFVVVGMLEEFVKHLVLRFADDEKIQTVDDALEFSIIVALGFVFVENILYFGKIWDASMSGITFTWFVFLRSTISVAAHVTFSAILGYYYGIARFAEDFYRQEVQEGKHIILQKMHQVLHLKGETLFHEEKMMEGMILAMVCHAIFNSFLEFEQVIMVVPILAFCFLCVLQLFHKKNRHTFEGHFLSHNS